MELSVEDVLEAISPEGRATLSFTVVGDPPVQARPKMAYRGCTFPIMYDPSSDDKLEFARTVRDELVQMQVATATSIYFKKSTSVALDAVFLLPRPQNHYIGTGNNKHLRPNVITYTEKGCQ